jgi:hypothetical protein
MKATKVAVGMKINGKNQMKDPRSTAENLYISPTDIFTGMGFAPLSVLP